MKLWNLTTFLTVLLLTFSGCVSTKPTPKYKAVVDSTLPIVTLTENGVFTDMRSVGFEWNAIKDSRVKGIYIYKQTIGEEETKLKHFDTVKSRFVTHYVDSEVEPGTQYGYYFKTFSKDLESESSPVKIVETLPILESVSWIHAVQDMPRTAKIIWRPHTNQIVKSYLLERKTLSEVKWNKLSVIKGRLNAEYIDAELKDDHVYKYRVRVLTYNNITSNPSKEVKVVTKALPKEVKDIVATKDLPKKIKVTWKREEIKDFLHFNIYRSEYINKSYKLLNSTKASEYIDDVEEDGKDYFYRVSAIDKDELESTHDIMSAHGKTLTKPTTPSLVEAKMVGNNIEISWNSIGSRIKSFVVNKSALKGWFGKDKEEFVGIVGKTFVDTAIEPETTYIYEVYSVDEFSIKSEPSEEIRFTTTAAQGRMIEHKDEGPALDVQKAPVQNDNNNVVQPVEDFDMSVL